MDFMIFVRGDCVFEWKKGSNWDKVIGNRVKNEQVLSEGTKRSILD